MGKGKRPSRAKSPAAWPPAPEELFNNRGDINEGPDLSDGYSSPSPPVQSPSASPSASPLQSTSPVQTRKQSPPPPPNNEEASTSTARQNEVNVNIGASTSKEVADDEMTDKEDEEDEDIVILTGSDIEVELSMEDKG